MRTINKKNLHHSVFWMIWMFLACSIMSCSDNKDEQDTKPYDPSLPVVITDFTPKAGGVGQRLVIYGNNFGNDLDKVSVFIGDKEAKVINVKSESIYCLVPGQAIKGNIEVHIGSESPIIAKADELFQYERKRVASTVAGYKTANNDQGWKDGKFKDPEQSKMASGFANDSWMTFDPLNPKHLWTAYDHNQLYLINFEDSTVTQHNTGFSRPRAIDFTIDKQHMLIAEDRGGENDQNVILLSRSSNFKDKTVVTRYKQCNTVAVHPVNGEMYFNSYEKGQFYRYDLNKYFSEGLGVKDYQQLFTVHDEQWEYRIIIHPTGNYAYIVVVNKHYILRCDYNWQKQRFNMPYLVCGQVKQEGYIDGVGTSARLRSPYQGIFVKNPAYVEGNKSDVYDFYFTDRDNHAIRILTPDGTVSTFAGRGSTSINANAYGYIDGDLREEARFNQPTGIAYNEEEDAFYINDKENRRLRKIALEDITEETEEEIDEE